MRFTNKEIEELLDMVDDSYYDEVVSMIREDDNGYWISESDYDEITMYMLKEDDSNPEAKHSIVDEIMSVIEGDQNVLKHYGMPRRSGRYPWGSGENPYQRDGDFISRVDALKKQGWTETPENIREAFGMTTGQYRAQRAICRDTRRMYDIAEAKGLAKDGLGASEIARKMSNSDRGTINESTVRYWLTANSETRMKQSRATAEFLKGHCDKKGMIEVGKGTEIQLGISKEKLKQSLEILKAEGYEVYSARVPQAANPNQMTTYTVLAPPGTPSKKRYDLESIHFIDEETSRDNGVTFEKKFSYPSSMDSKRIKIRYSEEGGLERDGTVELRRGVQDLDLGGSRYSQVRILVDGTHYVKGMAFYGEDKDFPKGVDVIFNTNKKKGTPMGDVLKEIKADPDNPFGSAIKDAKLGGQYWYTDKKTGEKKLGLINKRADEGDWTEWKDKLPSQFLSKQSLKLAKQQLNLAVADKRAEYEDIMALTQPTIKRHYLEEFANNCDSAAVHLQAAALPGQKYHVIIPANTLKDTEVYAPRYENGTKLALIRYPHGGTFEIPILTVNNKNQQGKRIIGEQSADAICVTKPVADRLSGADFDGDTVMCIPTHDSKRKVEITSTHPLKDLEGFEGKDTYGAAEVKIDSSGSKHYYRNDIEYPIMGKQYTQRQMGQISNLITDMTLKGATEDELARAVKHSMVVIDAAKHHLDYKASEIDNNIPALKKKYQDGGASTLISEAKSPYPVDKRQGSPKINIKGKEWYDPSRPEGSLIYKTADDLYYDKAKIRKRTTDPENATIRTSKKGKAYVQFDGDEGWTSLSSKTDLPEGTRVTAVKEKHKRTQDSTRMAETDDAFSLVSDANTPMERAYAEYANEMKRMANQARLEMLNAGKIAYDRNAAKVYKDEVESLEKKIKNSEANSPKERRAQIYANIEVKAKIEADPSLSKEDIRKLNTQALNKYREQVGSVSRRDRAVDITAREWEAIQAGAVHDNTLIRLLNAADKDKLRQLATPKQSSGMTDSEISRAKALAASNYSLADIAKKLGRSPSTISRVLKGA